MTPTGEQYAIAAFCEACVNDVPDDIRWYALRRSHDGKTLDDNIQAAIHAGEWLMKTTRYPDGSGGI